MPTYSISIVNSDFRVTNDLEANSLDDAYKLGLKGGLAIGSDEVCKGKPFFAAEVTVREGNRIARRFVVSVGASPLQ